MYELDMFDTKQLIIKMDEGTTNPHPYRFLIKNLILSYPHFDEPSRPPGDEHSGAQKKYSGDFVIPRCLEPKYKQIIMKIADKMGLSTSAISELMNGLDFFNDGLAVSVLKAKSLSKPSLIVNGEVLPEKDSRRESYFYTGVITALEAKFYKPKNISKMCVELISVSYQHPGKRLLSFVDVPLMSKPDMAIKCDLPPAPLADPTRIENS